ncbi:hypothetical protein CJ030_MR7G027963 [Morella rubra]|uniref:Uncharacterized protein n=1 Tax=Morella rubra TaxID=262757 RepID=A0A6A1UZN2_9ROSI|nr:hypothetical protein CJ030_MR7G027963 [Morella rubra]
MPVKVLPIAAFVRNAAKVSLISSISGVNFSEADYFSKPYNFNIEQVPENVQDDMMWFRNEVEGTTLDISQDFRTMILKFVKRVRRFTILEPPLGDTVKRWFIKDLGEKWRNYKCSLKHKFFNEAFTPQHVKSRSEAGKQSRSLQTSVHATGSKSFACHAHELEKEKQVPIDRTELYKAVYSCSDGSPMNPDVAEKIRRIEEIELNDPTSSQTLSQSRMGSNISWSPSDRYAQVMGPERHGRIRGIGLGPTPSSHPTNPNIISTQPESSNSAEMIEMQDQMKMMQSRISSLQSTIKMMAEAWNQLQNQNVTNPNPDQVPPTFPISSHASRKTFHDGADSAGAYGAGAGAEPAKN